MYCLLCHAKISRLRAWRTKSEFCSDEHAEAYKHQMLERLMVNESEGEKGKAEESAARAQERPQDVGEGGPTPAGSPPLATPESAADDPRPRQEAPPQQIEQETVSPIGAGPFDSGEEHQHQARAHADEPAASPQEQSAEQALAALRELAEGASRSKETKGTADEPDLPGASGPSAPGPPTTVGPEDPDALDELRRFAGHSVSDEAPETEQDAEEEIDVVSRSSALERLMQEATLSQASDDLGEDAGLEQIIRSEQVAASEAEDAQLEKAKQSSSAAQTGAPADDEGSREEAQAEPVAEAGSTPSSKEAIPEEAAHRKVVPFPGATEEAPREESEIAAISAEDQTVSSAAPAEKPQETEKPPQKHPLLPTKVVLEPMVDLFGSKYGQPSTEESQSGWGEFVKKVGGSRASLKELNGVIQSQALLSYPSGPEPAELKSELDLDLALLNALPDSAEPPAIEMERGGAEIADFKSDCMHPELVLLNFAISTSQAGEMVDASALLSGQGTLADSELFSSTQEESKVLEPDVSLAIPADFLRHCDDLGSFGKASLVFEELMLAGTAAGYSTGPDGGDRAAEPAGRSGVEQAGSLSQPPGGTMYPDRLFPDATETGIQSGQSLTSDRLVAADPQGPNSSAEAFPPIGELGQVRSKQGDAKDQGVLQPVIETKRPADRDLSDYV